MLSRLLFLILIFYFSQSPLGNNELFTPSTTSTKMVESASSVGFFGNEKRMFFLHRNVCYFFLFGSAMLLTTDLYSEKKVLYDDGYCECLI